MGELVSHVQQRSGACMRWVARQLAGPRVGMGLRVGVWTRWRMGEFAWIPASSFNPKP